MADTNLNILVRVEGARQASTEISSVGQATAHVGKQTEETSKKTKALRSTLGTVATGFLVYKGAQWIKGAVTETTNLAKSTLVLSRITGMDTHTAGGWVALAKERGIQTRQLNMGFITLAKQSQKLAEGSKTTVEAFQRLGISAKQWQGLNTEQRMEALADSFQHMRNPAERAALAQQLFGRSAQQLLPLLAQGKTHLAAVIAEQSKAAGETPKAVREQMKLVAQQREMNRAMLQLKVAVATALMPIMVQLTQILAPLTAAFASLMQKSGFFRIVVVALTAALIVFISVLKIAALMESAVLAGAAAPLAVLVGIAIVFVLLYTKVKWFHNAVDAVFRFIKAHWVLLAGILLTPILGPIAIIVALFHKQLLGAIKAVIGWIAAHWPLLVSIIGGPIGAVAVQVIKHFGDIRHTAESVFNAIKGVVETVANVVKSVLGGAFGAVKTTVEGIVKAIEKMISVAKGITSLPGKALGVLGKLSPFGQTGLYMGHAGTAIVGEQGPEMVHLPQGARVSPFVQSYAGAGGGPTVVQVPVYLDGRQIALAMGRYTADAKARR